MSLDYKPTDWRIVTSSDALCRMRDERRYWRQTDIA